MVMTRDVNAERRPDPPPDVSFVVATCNVAPFIAEALQSALDQAGVRVEVIVVDDASSDGTVDIVRKLARRDPRVLVLELPENRGPSHARNLAIANSSGRWIAILDGDDTIAPDRSRSLIALAEAAGADVVADNYARMTVDGRATGETMLGRDGDDFAILINATAYIRGNIMFDRRARLGALKPMVRAEFLRRHDLRMPEALSFAEDFIFCLACLRHGARLAVSSVRSYRYRMRSGSLSWRIGRAELAGIDRALVGLDLDHSDPGIEAALRDYRRALDEALSFSDVVAAAKDGRWASAIGIGATRRGVLPLIARFGSAAVWKRATALAGARRKVAGPGAAIA